MKETLDARIGLDSSRYSSGMNRVLRETNVAVGKISAQFSSLKNVLGFGAVGAFGTGMFQSLMAANIEAEKLQAAMTATAGNAALGKRQLDEVRTMAGDIGLGIQEAAKAMIQFQSAGMSSADAMDAIRAGYNAILSTGGGANEFGRFSVAIQQLRNSPKVLQEEINQLREALPTTARLMQDAFGATRAEDLQKLNISGKQFVDTLIAAMQKLPQIGDTLEKQIGRTQAKWQEFLGKTGEVFNPVAGGTLGAVNWLLDKAKEFRTFQNDLMMRAMGEDPEALRKVQKLAADIAEQNKAREDAARTQKELDAANAASFSRSAEQGKTLRGIFEKFNDILKQTAESAREVRAALDFEDRMRVFTDQERQNAFNESLDQTRQQLEDKFRERRERMGEAFNEFVGPQQMSDEEKGFWQDRVSRAGMSRSDRKAEREAEREDRRNIRRAADRETREQMREERRRNRENAFEDLKKNQGWVDEEARRKQLRDSNRDAARKAAEKQVMTLGEIRDILTRLATA